ncbi:alpha/beta hydrolase [Allobranchiibius sp. GilTou73]|uniref:alpha/beta hydrolase n=1 Tax=Allobranchiibius sp. GilTou73 TaxID=2904523 RepID=UPI001F343840|nr:alpha/beta hydrolase [Allobranchiibius sp. GilTou73]UIJ33993.1 alpha/beta hydrolase [Allobranchiibius sp. GilTou73]
MDERSALVAGGARLRSLWTASAGMPLRTRVISTGLAMSQGKPLSELSAGELQKRRALSPPPRGPVSWVVGRVTPGAVIETVQVPVRDGRTVSTRVLRSASGPSDTVLIWYHGGGWALGRPKDFDPLLSFLVEQTGCVVLAPDYRLAPEDKAPAGVHDCLDVLDWAATGAGGITTPAPRIAVGGDSAGGNLAALAALHARDRGLQLSGQVLVYPATDLATDRPYRNAPILSGEDMDAFEAFYLTGSGLTGTDPVVSPAHAASHADLAPALVQTAELDPLHPEGERYAQTLESAGVPTRYTCYRGVPHGFLNMPGGTHVGYQAWWEISDTLRRWWA